MRLLHNWSTSWRSDVFPFLKFQLRELLICSVTQHLAGLKVSSNRACVLWLSWKRYVFILDKKAIYYLDISVFRFLSMYFISACLSSLNQDEGLSELLCPEEDVCFLKALLWHSASDLSSGHVDLPLPALHLPPSHRRVYLILRANLL